MTCVSGCQHLPWCPAAVPSLQAFFEDAPHDLEHGTTVGLAAIRGYLDSRGLDSAAWWLDVQAKIVQVGLVTARLVPRVHWLGGWVGGRGGVVGMGCRSPSLHMCRRNSLWTWHARSSSPCSVITSAVQVLLYAMNRCCHACHLRLA